MLDIITKKINDLGWFSFFQTLRFRIAAMAFVVIVSALMLMSFMVLSTIESGLINDSKTDMFTKANIISTSIQREDINDTEYLAEMVSRHLSGTGMRAVITNNSYKIIYDSNLDRPSDGYLVREIVNLALRGEQAGTIKNSTLSVCVPISGDGAVYIEQSIASVYRMVRHVRLSLYIFSALILILLIALSIIISYIITSPLKDFISTAKEISKGNFKKRVTTKGTAEINELAQSMNYMCAELEHIDEKRQKFVSDASHELKTPMATIKLICDTIVSAQTPDIDMVKEFLADLSEEVDRLTRIVDRLLTLTRMDSDKSEFSPELTDYGMLINRIAGKIEPKATERNVIINCNIITENIEPVFMDYDKIWEAMYNIIDNAVKYTHQGSTVKIEVYVSGDELITTVADEGDGISDEYKERIFERFYRIDDSRARDTGGTGLGLAITKEMVSLHGGSIKVEDAQGGGSVFVVTLPYKTALDILPETNGELI